MAFFVARAHVARGYRRKGEANRMINFDDMTAMARTRLRRTVTLVRRDQPSNGFASRGIGKHRGRILVAGGAA
jgi:hypothetical protein